MTKKKRNLSCDMPLFEWVKKAQDLIKESNNLPAKGSLNIDVEFRTAISEDLRFAKNPITGREFSRYEVAGRMSDFLGIEVTASMLYNFTAESHDGHRFPGAWMPAFVYGTGGQRRALEIMVRHSGLFALPGPAALRADIQRINEDIKAKRDEKVRKVLLLKEIEG